MGRIALFAYGSLVDPASAAETLGRPVEVAAPARLRGWSSGFTVARDNLSSEKTFARADGSVPRLCLGLGLRPDPAAEAPNGALIELTEAELERLDLRELRYRRAEVTDAVEPADGGSHGFELVVAYRARAEHEAPEPPGDAIVIAEYARTAERAFAALGPGELELYRATTAPPPVEVVEATLVRDRVPPGNPRRW